MANPKKPARKRKAAKPVMAWAVLTDKGSYHIHSNWKKSLAQQYASTFVEKTEVVRVKIVEVRR